MSKDLETRYENLRVSVNSAIKKLCNKIEEINTEVKRIKEGKTPTDTKPCKECSCKKSNENMQQGLKKIEQNFTNLENELNERAIKEKETNTIIQLNKSKIQRIENDISDIVRMQQENIEKIKNVDNMIECI